MWATPGRRTRAIPYLANPEARTRLACGLLSRSDPIRLWWQELKEAVGDAVGQLKNKDVDEATQDQVSNDPEVKDWMQQFTADLTKMIVENSKNLMSEDKGDGKASGKSTSKNGATSWLEAIAIAMGEAAGNKAAKLVELSNKLTELSSAGGDEEEQQAAAKEMNAVNAQFQATSQEFNMLQNAFSNAIKAIGEGIQAARRANAPDHQRRCNVRQGVRLGEERDVRTDGDRRNVHGRLT